MAEEAEMTEEQFDAPEQQVEQDEVEIVDEPGIEEALDEAIGKPIDEREEEAEESEKAEDPKQLSPEEVQKEDDFKLDGEVTDKTRKTFDRLIGRLKERDTEYESLNHQYEGLRQTLTSTGAEPEQLARLLEYPRMLSNGNYQEAMAALDRERENLARIMGTPVEGVDLLGDFPDLREKVEYGDLPEEAAIELANARRREQAQSQYVRSQQENAQRQQYAQQQEVQFARQQLNAVGEAMKNVDPQYSAKMAQLRPVIQQIAQNYPPAQWTAAFQDAYSKVEIQRPRRSQQPLSGGGMANTGSGVPQSMEDAIAAGLSRASET